MSDVLFEFPLAVRRIFRRPKLVTVSEWNELNERHIPVTHRDKRWKNVNAPYAVGPMDAALFPSVREEVICAPPQTAKTEILFSVLAYLIDQRPGPAMYIMQGEKDARTMCRDRIRPMIKGTPVLAEYLASDDDDKSPLNLRLQHMLFYPGWGSSVSALASKPLRYVIFDEEDKMPETFKKETDPIRLGKLRTRTYTGSELVLRACSPTVEEGSIWRGLNSCQVVFHYAVRCPFCGHYQVMRFKQVKIPSDERDPEKIESKRLAWYECEALGCRWTDLDRDQAARKGRWITDDGVELFTYLDAERPTRIGFHYSALIVETVSMSATIAEHLRGLKDINARKNFSNAFMAEPWVIYSTSRTEEQILALRDDRPRGVVPGPDDDGLPVVAALTAGIDTQDERLFYYVIRAWAWGTEWTSWLVQEGMLQPGIGSDTSEWNLLENLLWSAPFRDPAGGEHWVELAIQDSRGHRTLEVYDFCRRFPRRILPYTGLQTQAQPTIFRKVEHYPGTDKPYPAGLKRLNVHSNFFKDRLATHLQIPAGDPGHFALHSEVSEDYARHLCAEYVDEKAGFWRCPNYKRSDWWDCEVMAMVGWYLIRDRYRERPSTSGAGAGRDKKIETPASEAPAAAAARQLAAASGDGLPGWFTGK